MNRTTIVFTAWLTAIGIILILAVFALLNSGNETAAIAVLVAAAVGVGLVRARL